MKLTAIEGNTQMLDGGAMYGNAPRIMWQRWSSPDNLNRIRLASRALLLQTGSTNILFETGIGVSLSPKLKKRYGVVESEHVLVDNLKKAGVSPEEINSVILSHLHFDHAGGMLSADKVASENAKLFFTHDPDVAFAGLKNDDATGRFYADRV